jgi:NagD protein
MASKEIAERLKSDAPESSLPGFVIDMDGVIYRGNVLIPGARDFVERLKTGSHPFIFLTNNSEKTPEELQKKLARMGVPVPADAFFTSAMATAKFLNSQRPKGRAYVIGGNGLKQALEQVGYVLTDRGPDYVIVGNSEDYGFSHIEKAIKLIREGARLIGTNPDLTGPLEKGIGPACGALIAPIELATGRRPYFIGKPNPLMMRMALRYLNVRSSQAFMVGDRMDTDIEAGLEAGMRTILVLSGVTSRKEINRFAYRPHLVYADVGQIPVEKLSSPFFR